MKIGIITFHDVINYGAVLQALALQETLKHMGHDAEIINYTPDNVGAIYKPFSYAKYRKYLRVSPKILLRAVASDIRHFGFVNKKRHNFLLFQKTHYTLSGTACKTLDALKNQNMNYDVCFAGSDQIWNPDITCGFDAAYFLDFGNENMVRASYAASIGRDAYMEEEKAQLIKLLERFQSISMREASAAEMIAPLSPVPTETVLDPTLLLSPEYWKKTVNLERKIDEKYLFVYTLYQNPELDAFVEAMSKKRNLAVVTINRKKKYTRELMPCCLADPGEFVSLIANAEYVVTNSFHGTAFCVNFGKNFTCFLGESRNARITNLLKKVNMTERAVTQYSESLLDMPEVDKTRVRAALDVEREKSMQFIKTTIEKVREK